MIQNIDMDFPIFYINPPPSNIQMVVEPTTPTLCLNMIVKNESKVIVRLLESVSKVVDSYCICDTGSTDNTIELIQSFFGELGIPGSIVKEPFRDFGYNRTFALNAAVGQPRADYLLLLDADMVFWLNPDVSPAAFKAGLTKADAFFIYQGTDSFYYKNTRIVRNNAGVKYWGVTHEFTELPGGFRTEQLQKSSVFIKDIGDGGAKGDKYERDIRLLQKGLLENPNQERYLFYLANSYYNGGYPDDAIKMYKKRIEVGGWFEEVWYSHYNIGKIYKEKKKDMANAIWWWLEGYRRYPNRIEQLYEIVKYYRENGAYELSQLYYELADRSRRKHTNWDYLFMEKDIYDYKLDYEFSIVGYYCNPASIDMCRLSMKVLGDPKIEDSLSKNTFSNYKFYAKRFAQSNTAGGGAPGYPAFLASVSSVGTATSAKWEDGATFFKSTPSIVCLSSAGANWSSTFVICQRYVNYYINDKGGYEQNGAITTRNVFGIIENGVLVKEFELAYDKSVDGAYVGLEDMRIWTNANAEDFSMPKIYYSSNRGLGHSNMVIEVGEIDLSAGSTVNSRQIRTDGSIQSRSVEKNWIIKDVITGTNAKTEFQMIYGWNPVVLGNVVENTFVPTMKQENLPRFFQYVRGSTNTIEVDGDLWAICHAVSYEDRRYYYHLFIVLDKETKRVKKYTPFFTFTGEKVEYTLGIALVKDQIVIGYSIMDNRTEWITVAKNFVAEQFIPLNN